MRRARRGRHPGVVPMDAGQDAPTIPIAAVPTIVHFGTGAQDMPDPDNPDRTVRHLLVALALSTPLGVHTYMLEPEQAHQVADQLNHCAALCHLENVGPDELERQLAAEAAAHAPQQ